MSSKLLDKLKKNSTSKLSSILDESILFTEVKHVTTDIPVFNIALSGSLDGGLTSGVTMFAGPSKHFKTAFSLLCAKAYLDKHKDAILLFYDSEFGSPQAYFRSFGIDPGRVYHTPIVDIEGLKFDIMAQLQNINRGDHIIIVIDSIGNVASKKEVDDAIDQKSVADMTRAKQLKSLFRMVTPHLTLKDIPLIAINHTYKEQGLFPKDIVSGGTGSYYSSSNIFVIGRRQEKTGTEITGYDFVIRIEKSRYVREGAKIPVTVTFKGGINKWSGLLEIAMEGGFVIKPSNGWYSRVDTDTGEVEDKKYREKDTYNDEFWNPIINSSKFREYVKQRYAISNDPIMRETDNVMIDVEDNDE